MLETPHPSEFQRPLMGWVWIVTETAHSELKIIGHRHPTHLHAIHEILYQIKQIIKFLQRHIISGDMLLILIGDVDCHNIK